MKPYLTWEDLLRDEPDSPSGIDQADEPSTAAPDDAPSGRSPDYRLPPELEALLAEKERLEQELKRMTGAAEPSQEDERVKRMYPVMVHTRESRIEERRLRHHDEDRRTQERRRLERQRLIARAEERREALEVERQKRDAERSRVQARWSRERGVALQEAARKRRVEAKWHARRDASDAAVLEHRKAEDDRLAQAYDDRVRAALSGAVARRKDARALEGRWYALRLRALERRKEERKEEEPRARRRSRRTDE